jgi:hypothetical protein
MFSAWFLWIYSLVDGSFKVGCLKAAAHVAAKDCITRVIRVVMFLLFPNNEALELQARNFKK